jgi:SAM-dependent methyltransferase
MEHERQHVDYERVAHRYHANRALGDEQLAGWREAVTARLPRPDPIVLDLGSGTGVFVDAWRAWGARQVVALEPSAAMRQEAGEHGFQVVGAVGEDLPLADACVDVAWISAVVHHFTDFAAAAAEVRRVVRPDGRVFVRGLVPGSSRIPWLELFPGHERALARFPDERALIELFSGADLHHVDTVEVLERHGHTGEDTARWVENMRDADSMLTALTDDEIAAGLTALRGLGERALAGVSLSLVTFRVNESLSR